VRSRAAPPPLSDNADTDKREPTIPQRSKPSYAGAPLNSEESRMKDTPVTPGRADASHPLEMAALFGEYAALAQHPGEDNERLALAIRVVEALQLDARDAARLDAQ
jgi:hypothetical protein